MAITTLDGFIAAAKQLVPYYKTATMTTVALRYFTCHDEAGNPGAATLNVGNTANGLVPTDATTGFPVINAFGSGASGYLAIVNFNNTVATNLLLYDRLFHAGAFSFNANVTLTAQPAFSGRCPDYSGGANWGAGNEIWLEQVTASTGTQSVAVTYTNQAGVTGRTTGVFSVGAAFTVGSMIKLPLQAGDSGVQKIESVVGTVATAGTFNILVARPLWMARVPVANGGDVHGIDRTGMPVVYADSALALATQPDSTSAGLPSLHLTIANG